MIGEKREYRVDKSDAYSGDMQVKHPSAWHNLLKETSAS